MIDVLAQVAVGTAAVAFIVALSAALCWPFAWTDRHRPLREITNPFSLTFSLMARALKPALIVGLVSVVLAIVFGMIGYDEGT